MTIKINKPLKKSTTGGVNFKSLDQSSWRHQIKNRRVKFTDDAKYVFLEHFKETNLVMRSCQAAGISHTTLMAHLDNDPEFQEAFEEAKICYKEKVISHVQNLAFNGIKNPIFAGKDGDYKGDRTDYPISLVILEAKKVDSGYRDKQGIDISTSGGVLVAPAGMTAQEWIMDQMAKNTQKNDQV